MGAKIKNIIRGASTVVDILPAKNGRIGTGHHWGSLSDSQAIERDWIKVGDTIKSATTTVSSSKQNGKKRK